MCGVSTGCPRRGRGGGSVFYHRCRCGVCANRSVAESAHRGNPALAIYIAFEGSTFFPTSGREEKNVNKRDYEHIDRRTFLKVAGTAGAAAGLAHAPGAMTFAQAAEKPSAPDIIHGKSPEMIVHNAKIGVMETPLNMLREHKFTPEEILYNRTHFPVDGEGKWVATTAPADRETVQNWTILVSGLVQRPKSIKVTDLEQMDRVKRVSVMQCAGNGRSYYWAKGKTPGSGWKHGGM